MGWQYPFLALLAHDPLFLVDLHLVFWVEHLDAVIAITILAEEPFALPTEDEDPAANWNLAESSRYALAKIVATPGRCLYAN